MTVYHKASLIHPSGGISALCFSRPQAINLRKASWTIRNEAVTCAKCLALMKTLNELNSNSDEIDKIKTGSEILSK